MMKIKALVLAAMFAAPVMALDYEEAHRACDHGSTVIRAVMLDRFAGLSHPAAIIAVHAHSKNPVAVEEYTIMVNYAYSIPPAAGKIAQLAQAESERKAAYMRCITAYGY